MGDRFWSSGFCMEPATRGPAAALQDRIPSHAGPDAESRDDAVFPAVPTLCRITLVRRSHFRPTIVIAA